jgi:SAM-dependent methyltransferase
MTDPLTDSSLERTASHWSAEAGTGIVGRGRTWLEVPAVRDRIARLISGRSDADAFHWLVEVLAKRAMSTPLERVLSLGCGAGNLERRLFSMDVARHYEGIDVAPQAIERARIAADALPGADIRYSVADINTITLQANHYDAIFCHMSAHHFSDLEKIFFEVHKALKPGGIFFLDEYVGPKQFQWLPHQVGLIDLLRRHLPERWVRTAEGEYLRGFRGPTVDELVAVDPTEAIRSNEVLQVLARQFVVTEHVGYGGTLLHGLLDQIGVNFVDGDVEADAMLNTFFALEDWALEHRVFEHDFAVMVAERPQDVGRPAGLGFAGASTLWAQQDQEVEALRAQIAALKASTSWRVTAPLRGLRRLIGRVR